jgi:hypothetical protein
MGRSLVSRLVLVVLSVVMVGSILAAFPAAPLVRSAATCCTPSFVLICQREGLRCGFDDFGNCGCQLDGPK